MEQTPKKVIVHFFLFFRLAWVLVTLNFFAIFLLAWVWTRNFYFFWLALIWATLIFFSQIFRLARVRVIKFFFFKFFRLALTGSNLFSIFQSGLGLRSSGLASELDREFSSLSVSGTIFFYFLTLLFWYICKCCLHYTKIVYSSFDK